MAMGPGKYDDLCTHVRTEAEAQAAIVVVFGGKRGDGFSMQVVGGPLGIVALRASLGRILRDIANTLDQSEEL